MLTFPPSGREKQANGPQHFSVKVVVSIGGATLSHFCSTSNDKFLVLSKNSLMLYCSLAFRRRELKQCLLCRCYLGRGTLNGVALFYTSQKSQKSLPCGTSSPVNSSYFAFAVQRNQSSDSSRSLRLKIGADP